MQKHISGHHMVHVHPGASFAINQRIDSEGNTYFALDVNDDDRPYTSVVTLFLKPASLEELTRAINEAFVASV